MTGDEATQRAMAGPEIPHNEAGIPIIGEDKIIEIDENGKVHYPHSKAAQFEVIRKAIELLCGRIGGCLGETCGCVKGTLDMKPSSETRRKAAWDYLRGHDTYTGEEK